MSACNPAVDAALEKLQRDSFSYFLHESHRYGFKATFHPTYPEKSGICDAWVSPWHFGLNIGPSVPMIENYRTGLLWQLMRQCPYIATGLRRAGFTGGRL